MFTELIVDVFDQLKQASWSSSSQFEIGFYLKNKITKSAIFFGIWFEAWESFGIPLSIVLDYGGKSTTDKYNVIEKSIRDKKNPSLIFKRDYNDYALILIDHGYLNFVNDHERIATFLSQLARQMEIDL